MSYNAIVLNKILAYNASQTDEFNELLYNNKKFSHDVSCVVNEGYGAFDSSQLKTTNNSNLPFNSVIDSRYGTTVVSNIWGVPEINNPLLNEDDLDNYQDL